MKDGFDQLIESIEKMNSEIQSWLSNFLYERALEALKNTQQRTPVVTGRLKRSWKLGDVTFTGKEFQVELINETEYASEIEYGFTHKNGRYPGRHMAEISAQEVMNAMPRKLETEWKKFAKGFGWT